MSIRTVTLEDLISQYLEKNWILHSVSPPEEGTTKVEIAPQASLERSENHSNCCFDWACCIHTLTCGCISLNSPREERGRSATLSFLQQKKGSSLTLLVNEITNYNTIMGKLTQMHSEGTRESSPLIRS